MSQQRLLHDSAWAIATHVLSVFEPLLLDMEKCDAFKECYQAVRAGMEAFVLLQERERRRLDPSQN